MNLPNFISSRISKQSKGSFSYIISRVAVVSIAVGVASLLLAFMILQGFQGKILDKIYSFSGHLIVSKYSLSNSFEEAISVNDTLTNQLDNIPEIRHWQPFIYKAGLLKTSEEVQGVVIKGVSFEDSTSLSRHLFSGRLPDVSGKKYSTEVVLSQRIARYLNVDVGDEVLVFFIQNPPRIVQSNSIDLYCLYAQYDA